MPFTVGGQRKGLQTLLFGQLLMGSDTDCSSLGLQATSREERPRNERLPGRLPTNIVYRTRGIDCLAGDSLGTFRLSPHEAYWRGDHLQDRTAEGYMTWTFHGSMRFVSIRQHQY